MTLLIRTQQRLLPRAIDTLLTLLAWCGMAHLLVHGVSTVLANRQQDPQPSLSMEFLLTLDTLLIYLLVALGISVLLLIWAKYNEQRAESCQRRVRAPDICERGLSESFQVSMAVLDCLQNEQVLILHNNEHGALATVVFPESALRLPALAVPRQRLTLSGRRLGQAENAGLLR